MRREPFQPLKSLYKLADAGYHSAGATRRCCNSIGRRADYCRHSADPDLTFEFWTLREQDPGVHGRDTAAWAANASGRVAAGPVRSEAK